MRLQIHQSAGPRDRGVVRRALVQRNPHKLPDGERVAGPPRDSPFTVNAFEVAYQQKSKIDPGRHARPSHRGSIEALALPFHKSVKVVFRKKLIQALVKGMTRGSSQGAGWNP